MIRAFGGSFLPSRLTLALIAASGLALAATQVAAQDTVIIGGGGRPAVEVNLDALNDLGPGPRVRRLRMPGETAPAGAIVLRPPGGVAIARTTPPPSLRPPRPAQTARPPVQVTQPAAPTPPPQAARPAPPPAPATTETARVARPRRRLAGSRRHRRRLPPSRPRSHRRHRPPRRASSPRHRPRCAPPPPRAQIAAVEEEPVAAPQQRETETAAVAPRAALPEGGGQALRVVFSGASTRLTNDATARLDQLPTPFLRPKTASSSKRSPVAARTGRGPRAGCRCRAPSPSAPT